MWPQTLAEEFLSAKHQKDSTTLCLCIASGFRLCECMHLFSELQGTWILNMRCHVKGCVSTRCLCLIYMSQNVKSPLWHPFPSHMHRHINICQGALGTEYVRQCVAILHVIKLFFPALYCLLLFSFTFWREESNLTPFVRNNISPLEFHSSCLESYQIQTHTATCLEKKNLI